MSMFKKAVREKLKAKICLEGAAGSGKTCTALRLAMGFGGKVALLDTENRSSLLFADRPDFDFDFDIVPLYPPFAPESYIEIIKDAEKSGFSTLIIDSGSHEWEGPGGCLNIHSLIGGNTFTAWDKVTPRHNNFIRAIIDSPINVITCLRTKTGYEMGTDDKGKAHVEKQGLKPITREGFDYENTIVFVLNQNNVACQTKDRTGLFIGKDAKLTEKDGKKIIKWLDNAVDPTVVPVITIESAFRDSKNNDELTMAYTKYRDDILSKPDADQELLRVVYKEMNTSFKDPVK